MSSVSMGGGGWVVVRGEDVGVSPRIEIVEGGRGKSTRS